jgi:hypothetical protein
MEISAISSDDSYESYREEEKDDYRTLKRVGEAAFFAIGGFALGVFIASKKKRTIFQPGEISPISIDLEVESLPSTTASLSRNTNTPTNSPIHCFQRPPPPLPARAMPEPSSCPPLPPRIRKSLYTSESERSTIITLFTEIADTYPVILWSQKAKHEKTGKAIDWVHPFAVLMHIPPEKMKIILKSKVKVPLFNKIPTKASEFLKQTIDSIKKHALQNDTICYSSRVAEHFSKDEADVRQMIVESKWEELIHFLFDIEP